MPKPNLLDFSTSASNACALSPAFSIICINGAFREFFTIFAPSSSLDILLAKFTNVTPPPATIPSASAALVAATASSTLNFFSSISVSVAPPTFITATLPDNAAARFSNSSRS